MKKLPVLIVVIVTVSLSACHSRHHDIDISFKDADHYFYMDAGFDHNKTRRVERYMNRELGDQNKFSFVNTRTSATITLDDNTKFFLRKEPGHIRIKLNKDENSPAAYSRIKSMCEGMKEVMIR